MRLLGWRGAGRKKSSSVLLSSSSTIRIFTLALQWHFALHVTSRGLTPEKGSLQLLNVHSWVKCPPLHDSGRSCEERSRMFLSPQHSVLQAVQSLRSRSSAFSPQLLSARVASLNSTGLSSWLI